MYAVVYGCDDGEWKGWMVEVLFRFNYKVLHIYIKVIIKMLRSRRGQCWFIQLSFLKTLKNV